MDPSAKVRCSCGQVFSVWLPQGTRRSRCPFCKLPLAAEADIIDATLVEEEPRPVAPTARSASNDSPFRDPPTTGSPFRDASMASPKVAVMPPPAPPRVAIQPDAWLWAVTLGVHVAAVFLGIAWLLDSPTAYFLAIGACLFVAVATFLIVRFNSWTAPLDLDAPTCPQCKESAAVRVHLTWWGGVLGTRLAQHVQCSRCGCRYGRSTGEDHAYPIITVAATRVAILLALLTIVLYFVAAGWAEPSPR